jgi:hypothetical protein
MGLSDYIRIEKIQLIMKADTSTQTAYRSPEWITAWRRWLVLVQETNYRSKL